MSDARKQDTIAALERLIEKVRNGEASLARFWAGIDEHRNDILTFEFEVKRDQQIHDK